MVKSDVTNGYVKSCGCLHREKSSERMKILGKNTPKRIQARKDQECLDALLIELEGI